VEHIDRLGIEGPTFAALVREALEAEYGGEIDAVLDDFKQQTLEDPKKFAGELFKIFETQAMQYFVTIIKFAESGRFHPEEELEQEKGDEEFESLVRETEPNPGLGTGTDSPP